MNAFDFSAVPDLSGLPPDELAWLAAHCELECYEAGETIFDYGDAIEGLRIVLSGHIDLIQKKGAQEVAYLTILAGELTGRFPFSRMQGSKALARAATTVQSAILHRDHFAQMQQYAPQLLERLVGLMLDRTREFTRLSEQQERLVSLGTMSAGLAHELNNPAAAAHRAATTLLDALQAFDELSTTLLKEIIFAPGELSEKEAFKPLYSVLKAAPEELGALEQSDQEDALSELLEDHGLQKSWEAAGTLVAGGVTREVLEPLIATVKPERVVSVLGWLARDVEMRTLARELLESTRRISELVGAMKAYSYLDQAKEKRPTDLKEGLINTLMILKHKFKKKDVQLVKDFAPLPNVPVHGAELNQVWTNLLDNALDAVPETGGVITLRTMLDASGNYACVDIGDNGPGIPDAVQRRMFEPFYTTKGVGEGTGMGLDIVRRIVSNQHKGSIRVQSVPGETHFIVRLPLH